MEFQGETGREVRSSHAVQGSDGQSFPLLLQTVRRGKIETDYQRSEIGLVHLINRPPTCRLIHSLQIPANEPKDRSGQHCPKRPSEHGSRVVVRNEFQLLLIVVFEILRHRHPQVEIRNDCVIQVPHGWQSELQGGEVEHQFHLGYLRGMLRLELREDRPYLLVPIGLQHPIIRAVIEDTVQRVGRYGLEALFQGKSRPTGSLPSQKWRNQPVASHLFRDHPSLLSGEQPIQK